MAKWMSKIDLASVWPDGNPVVIAQTIATSLKTMTPFANVEVELKRQELAEEFAELSTFPDLSGNELDSHMNDLYDWADTPLDADTIFGRKVCWIATF